MPHGTPMNAHDYLERAVHHDQKAAAARRLGFEEGALDHERASLQHFEMAHQLEQRSLTA